MMQSIDSGLFGDSPQRQHQRRGLQQDKLNKLAAGHTGRVICNIGAYQSITFPLTSC